MDNHFICTKAEVKTIYSIEIPSSEILNILDIIRESPLKDIYWKCEGIDLDDYEHIPFKQVKENFIRLWKVMKGKNETETIQFIIRELGFDGIENFGYYDERNRCIKLSVFRYGDKVN